MKSQVDVTRTTISRERSPSAWIVALLLAVILMPQAALAAGPEPSPTPTQSPSPDPSTGGRTWERAQKLLHFDNEAQGFTEGACAKTIQTSKNPIRSCAGLIDTFDGLSLSVGIRIPEEATESLPTLLYLHGFTSNRGEFASTLSGWGGDMISDSLAADGYVVVMPSARGMGGSCGLTPATGPHAEEVPPLPQLETPHGPSYPGAPSDPDFTCSRGWSHIAERDFEIRDYQHLLGLLVDAGVADPDRLGVAGYSYGGGQSWLLATSEPWLTPRGDQKISLAAAVPIAGWTSNQNALTPNGRATDDPGGGRSLERPFGVLKESSTLSLFAGARQGVLVVLHPARMNEADPSEFHSFTTGWLAVYEKGEPYDTHEGNAVATMLRNKSALYADDYFSGLQAGAFEPVPILAIQGWNDSSFPAVEALGMYRKLKAVDPDYPISVFLGDIGHANGRGFGTEPVKTAWQRMAREFLDSYLLHPGEDAPIEQVVSMSTECPVGLEFREYSFNPQDNSFNSVPTSETIIVDDWDSIHPGLLTLKGDGPLTTESGPPNLVEEAATDPVIAGPGCMTQAAGTYDEDVDYTWPVPSGGFTLLGLPKLMADFQLSGVDATVVAKLWDVDASGHRTLVTRGVYRLSLAGGDRPAGKLKFDLFGNHYRFVDGHSIELEISQTDYPFLRPDSFASAITYKDVKLELPTPNDDDREMEE